MFKSKYNLNKSLKNTGITPVATDIISYLMTMEKNINQTNIFNDYKLDRNTKLLADKISQNSSPSNLDFINVNF